MARCRNVILLIFLAAVVRAQTLPDAPDSPTITNLDRILMPLAVASIGVDAYATHLDWTPRPGISTAEVNPIARAFVSHGTAPLVAYFAAGAGAFVYAHHKVASRHRKLALGMDLVVMGSEIHFTQYSFRHHIE
ncbi:MAG TPA: hypothetical protein VMP68_13585 [Candidatus Eisenbacteria bacterium]|nr:hypothetical protein [Candidatus Eisenbacteria bacterium]